jgi:hypothetical protein
MALMCVVGGAIACTLSGCGTFDSAASGNNLIKTYVKSKGRNVTLVSSKCPSNVALKSGGSYSCPVVLKDTKTGQRVPATVTVHMTSKQVEIDGAQDVHLR